MKRKVTIAERLARRPGPRSPRASKAIAQSHQRVDPQITLELNRDLRVSPPPRRGAPKGNKNRLVHGKFTGKRQAFLAKIRTFVRESNWLVRQVWSARPMANSGRRLPTPTRHIVERIGR